MSTLNAITSGAGGVALSGDTSGNLVIQSAGTNVATFTTGGNLNFAVSNAGINFNNSGAIGSSTLNDYETGTWTPTFNFAGNSVGMTYSNQYAYYVKVGKVITVVGYITMSNKGSSTGQMRLGGLPFNVQNISNVYQAGTAGWYTGFTGLTYGGVAFDIAPNGTYFTMITNGTANTVALNESYCTNSAGIEFSVTYTTN